MAGARRRGRRGLAAMAAAAVALVLIPNPVGADGFLTDKDPYLQLEAGAPPGSSLLPIISVGEEVGDYMFEGIPDGIGLSPGPDGSVYAFVSHEQSHVPFRNQADFQDASVSKLRLDTAMGGVLEGSVPIPASDGYIRFCSAFMAGPAEGFENYTFFANEESNDVVPVPDGAPYGADPSIAPNRQAGYAVILDAESGAYRQVAGMGRHNHENSVVVPGDWEDDQIAVLSTDDTFNAPSSQLYLYLAEEEEDLWEDTGSLWAFRVTHKNGAKIDEKDAHNGANDYGNIAVGDDLEGRFIRVPKKIADGVTDERPQDALENWSNENNVFQFIRLEDLAYDRNDPHVVYLADTGEARALQDEAGSGRLIRGPSGTQGPFPNGRIFQMVFGEDNPKKVESFTILLDNDLGGYNNPAVMHAPDNMDTSPNSLMVQEDSGQPPTSRIWRYEFSTGQWTVVASVLDQDWESSGIVDASAWFGDGAWLVDVQAHDQFVDQEQQGDVLVKREDGQLLLMVLPGTT